MPKDDQIHVRLSSKKKELIKKRAESLDRSVSQHLLICYDLEFSIAKGESIVIPKPKQIDAEGISAINKGVF